MPTSVMEHCCKVAKLQANDGDQRELITKQR